jgi:hypothetical protein
MNLDNITKTAHYYLYTSIQYSVLRSASDVVESSILTSMLALIDVSISHSIRVSVRSPIEDSIWLQYESR